MSLTQTISLLLDQQSRSQLTADMAAADATLQGNARMA